MVTISLSDTTLAYLAAAALIGTLVFLALRNQKQGWRKQRVSWVEARSNAALRAFTIPDKRILSEQPLQHVGDLNRLREALTVHGEPQSPEKETIKSNVLA